MCCYAVGESDIMEGTQRMALSFSVLALGVLIRCALALQQDWRQSIQQVYSVNYPPTSSQAGKSCYTKNVTIERRIYV